jgi:hypothetical protein
VKRSEALVKSAAISLHLTQSLTIIALHQKMHQKFLSSGAHELRKVQLPLSEVDTAQQLPLSEVHQIHKVQKVSQEVSIAQFIPAGSASRCKKSPVKRVKVRQPMTAPIVDYPDNQSA